MSTHHLLFASVFLYAILLCFKRQGEGKDHSCGQWQVGTSPKASE